VAGAVLADDILPDDGGGFFFGKREGDDDESNADGKDGGEGKERALKTVAGFFDELGVVGAHGVSCDEKGAHCSGLVAAIYSRTPKVSDKARR